MSSQKEIAQRLKLSERRVRGLQAQGVFPKGGTPGEARKKYVKWKEQAAARRAAAREADMNDVGLESPGFDDDFDNGFPRFSKEFWREIELDAKKTMSARRRGKRGKRWVSNP